MKALFLGLTLLNIGIALFNVYAFSLGGMLRWVNFGCVFVNGALALITLYCYRKART